MGFLNSGIWRDQTVRKLTTRQTLLLIGLVSLSGNRNVLLGKPENVKDALYLYESHEEDAFRKDLQVLSGNGLVGPAGTWPRYVEIDRDFEYAAKRPPIPRHLRDAVIERDGMVCGICGEEIPAGDLHIDHVVPIARGGSDALGNLQPAHSLCNLRKGARV